jgi:predicted ferric reductase
LRLVSSLFRTSKHRSLEKLTDSCRLAACNLVLAIFLGLKNTILSPIAGKSYDSINILHRACGYTTIALMILHSTNMVAYLYAKHATKYLNLPGQYAAAVAGFSMLTIGFTAFHPIRRRFYELFYVAHIVLVLTILITLYIHLHQINWAAKTFPVVGAAIWGADRLIRWGKWAYFSAGNSCTLVALPEGATKVIMKRDIAGRPGSHAFLAIPRVRPFQTHPFTLASNKPATFVIAAHNGFTKALHKLAQKNPTKTYRAGIEGSYGHVPAVNSYDRAILVGGGSGATFTIALAMDWLSKQGGKEAGPVHSLAFIWAIKHEGTSKIPLPGTSNKLLINSRLPRLV